MKKYNVRMFYTTTYYHETSIEADSEEAARDMAHEVIWNTDVKNEWKELDDVSADFDIEEIKG